MKRVMVCMSDDGKVQGTAKEVRAYEAQKEFAKMYDDLVDGQLCANNVTVCGDDVVNWIMENRDVIQELLNATKVKKS